MHGTTVHGLQRSPRDPELIRAARAGAVAILSAAGPLQAFTTSAAVQDTLRDIRNEPMAYFHRKGPIGQFFTAINLRRPLRRIGILGLGSGTLLAYLQPGQHATIYEIDDLAVRIAEDPRYFTYLRDTRGSYDIVMGDGRLKLAEAADGSYDLLFMDAFSSDSIPVHLVTREAIELYFRKLAPDGVLVINVANRYLKPAAVLANIAAELGLVGLTRYDEEGTGQPANLDTIVAALGVEQATALTAYDGYVPGKYISSWVVLARAPSHFGLLTGSDAGVENEFRLFALAGLQRGGFALPLVHGSFTLPTRRWNVLLPEPDKGVWTDDYSNLFRIMNR
jgi:SAM-dependent methyltransferase